MVVLARVDVELDLSAFSLLVQLQPNGRRARGKKKAAKKAGTARARGARGAAARVPYPKDPLLKSLRMPQAIFEQNAGNACTPKEASDYAHIGWTGQIAVEISSAIKYGLLERPSPGKIKPTDRVRKIVRPEQPTDKVDALREAVMTAPVISDLYKKYRGEKEFIANTAINSFGIPKDQVEEFISVFLQTLTDAELLQDVGDGKTRVLDVTTQPPICQPVRLVKSS